MMIRGVQKSGARMVTRTLLGAFASDPGGGANSICRWGRWDPRRCYRHEEVEMDHGTHYRYLIVGGGMTADAAVRGIRSGTRPARSASSAPNRTRRTNRPPLSKALWKGKPLDKIWRRTDERSVDMHLGRRAVARP